jgi:hypothetical protein
MEAQWKILIEAILKICKCSMSVCDQMYLLSFINMSAFPDTHDTSI